MVILSKLNDILTSKFYTFCFIKKKKHKPTESLSFIKKKFLPVELLKFCLSGLCSSISEHPDQMTYLPSSSDFPLVRCAGVGVAGLEGRTTDHWGWEGDSARRAAVSTGTYG